MLVLKQKNKKKFLAALSLYFAVFILTLVISPAKMARSAGNAENGEYCGTDGSICLSGYCGIASNLCEDKPASTNTASGKVSKTLSQGSSGDEVVILQRALNNNGANITDDGKFGTATLNAVKQYQSQHGLTVDGIAGPATLSALGIYAAPSGGGGGSVPPGGGGSATIDCPAGTSQQNGKGICLPNSPFDTGSFAGSSNLDDLTVKLIKWLLYGAGTVAVIFVIIGGYDYVTSAGNEETAEKGRKILINAFIGLVVIIMAYAIVTIINNILSGSDSGSSTTSTNNSTIRRAGVNPDGSPIQ